MADKVIGSYRITQTLGAGGMGAVYAGEHVKLGRKAAIKVLLPELSGNEELVTRFFNEARAATAIKHPGIVQIYDLGYQDDQDSRSAYIAMEFLEGEGLDARLRRLGQLPVQQALRFTGQIASALAVAHGRGIVHRDLKPANLFIVPDAQVVGGERIKILDFGIAKITHTGDPGAGLTQAGALMGSPSYMAPEQCRGAANADHRADLYSLGCILFECLCGRPPFLASEGGYITILAAHLEDAPPVPSSLRPELTPEIDNLILHLLVKEPYARPESAAHVAHAVSVLSGEQVSFGAMSAATEVFDAPVGLDAIPTQSTSPGTGRLIDQLTSRSRRSTGGITGAMSAGVTGRNTDQMGGIAAAQRTARSKLSQERLPTQSTQPARSRHLLWGGAVFLAVCAGVTASQLGQRPAPPVTPAVRIDTEATTATPEPAPAPARERGPKLTFRPIVEDGATRARGRSVAGSAAAAPVVLRLPTLSWSSLLSGNFFSGLSANLDTLVASLGVIARPEPVLITWKLSTSPPGAQVLRGDQVVGNTAQPLIIELEQTPGFTETFTLRLDRYRDQTIELRGDQPFDQVIELEPMLFAWIESRPAGAEVLDAQGQPLGVTPYEVAIDPAAPPALTLRLERYEDTPLDLAASLAADLAASKPGKRLEKRVKLVPKVYATVISRPEGAEVFDAQGQSLGAAPVEIELVRGADGEVAPAAVTLELDRHDAAVVELAGERSFRKQVRLVPKIYATVTSKPEGAEVLDAEGQSLGVTPVTFELPRAAQPGRVTLRLDGHMDAEAVLRGGRSFTKNVKLPARPKLTIVSEPAGAQVLDAQGQALGAAPLEVLLSGKGEPVAFTLRLDGHHDERIEVKTRRDKTVRASLAPELGPVTVRIESTPPGAEVRKNGELLGRTPLDDRFEGVDATVTYKLELDGYADRELRVRGDRNATEQIELKKCAPKRSGQLGIVTVYGGC